MELNDFQNKFFQLESDLHAVLRPVSPRQEFVDYLEHRLINVPNWKIILPSIVQGVSLALAFAAGIVIIVTTGIRAATVVLGIAAIIRKMRSV